MSSNYTGNKTGNHPPAVSPAPGQSPLVVSPADTDPNNVATMFAQQYPTLADYIAWLQASANFSPPFKGPGGNLGGYSTVTHTGGGGGTVTPTDGSKAATGTNFVIKMIVGGTVGTATFQTSVNGGTSFGSTQTTSASMTDATSGITLAFSGVFTGGDTYQFNSAFTPLVSYANTDGYVRNFVDHNGYIDMGRVGWLDQNWAGIDFAGRSLALAPSGGYFLDGYTWKGKGQGANSSEGLTENSYAGSTSLMHYQGLAGGSSGDYNFVYTSNGLFVPTADTVAVAEFEAFLDHSGVTESVWQFGFTNNTSNTALSSDNKFMMEMVTGDTTWYIRTADGSSSSRVNTGVTIDTTNMQKFRMELYGANSPYGALARVFINGKGPYDYTSNLPFGTSGLMLFWGMHGYYVTGTMPSHFLYFSPLRIRWNRWPGSTTPLI